MNEMMESKLGERARNRDGKNNRSINTDGNRETTRKKNSENSIVEKEETWNRRAKETRHFSLRCGLRWNFFPK
jgi:hypothetical protein